MIERRRRRSVMGKALNLILPPTTQKCNGYQPCSWRVSLRQTSVLSRWDIILSCLRYRIRGDKHRQNGPLGLKPASSKRRTDDQWEGGGVSMC